MRLEDPRDCAPTIKAADGRTTLHRFRLDAVIYAPSLAAAQRRLEEDLYLDAGRITEEESLLERARTVRRKFYSQEGFDVDALLVDAVEVCVAIAERYDHKVPA